MKTLCLNGCGFPSKRVNRKFCSIECYRKYEKKYGGNATIHGMRKTRQYRTWSHMIGRCEDVGDSSYKNYGGRGISVCKRWKKFENFWEDMKDDYKEDLTLERIDVNGNYSPENCKWATWKDQHRNKRSSRLVVYRGETKNISDWANLLGIKRTTLRMRLDVYKYSVEKAFNEKVEYNHGSK